ncbi:DNA-binding protein [Pseudomonas chlororaphis subsp. piscium]|uniref:ImmA/IrrE family metallo-endopeptidase n=1 Tax=Pseudomonas chlororaphis TaxID=587753 RepID=UPI00087AC532|nr:ImmA/IrrE family metallo-endopeptidase [Pseudomonas chlororaphis]AZC30099.1 DNA-binding protein [Pseudomonas chlororaphis subsp. piscium]WDG94031.1 ImmA/IrrE family metallo-endopeptidase [Pseudomonas chlororaphis]SDT24940.1 Zn-dependent peptidase ImmA, M78 family [Pseudomonas chlororaphis]
MEALINPQILRWARSRARISTGTLAKSLGTAEDNVLAWEDGIKRPTFNQAMNYAHHTHIPFGYLYLAHPPVEDLPLPDLRTVNGREPSYSLALRDTIRWAMERQEWYRDWLKTQGYEENEIVGRHSMHDGVMAVVSSMRKELQLPELPRRGTFDDYFSELVKNIENIGVLVMRNSIVNNNTSRPLSVDEFRGFAISDKIAPLIFINTGDCPEARLFTLIHELAHIWIGKSGVSDSEPQSQMNEEEFCNAVAAEFLTPERAFRAIWKQLEDWKENLPLITRTFHVSEWVAARRALTCGFITKLEYGKFIAEKIATYKARNKDGAPPYNRLQTGRVSKALAAAVASEALSGGMLLRDAARLIGIKPHKISEYSKKELGF